MMNLERLKVLFVIFVFYPYGVLVVTSFMTFQFYVMPRALRAWAERNGFRLEERRNRNFFLGPFPFGHPFKNCCTTQAIYKITVRTDSGEVRKGWVRLDNKRGHCYFSTQDEMSGLTA